MKIAICVEEKLTRTVLVDADNYEEAEKKVSKAYDECKLILTPDNSIVEVEYRDDTEQYIDVFGLNEFDAMEEDGCFKETVMP